MAIGHRPLESQDAKRICAFVQSAEELFFFFPKASFPLTPEVLLAESGQRHSPTVALDGDNVVGYVNFIEARPKRFCTLGNLVVDPAFRRRGVARYLVRTMVSIAVDQYAAKFVKASCFSHNTSAYQMYHDLGFRPDDMVPRTTTGGDTVLLVNMILRRPSSSYG